MRGIQPVLYGYFISSWIYFYAYAHSKIAIKRYLDVDDTNTTTSTDNPLNSEQDEQKNVKTTMQSSFVASGLAELICLTFYYPYDLIKTRMQVYNQAHRYNGVLDAFIKIYQENYTLNSSSTIATNRILSII
jgi:hypothetical protein